MVASLIMGAPADGVVAKGESNGEPELLEWLSVDCLCVFVFRFVCLLPTCENERHAEKKREREREKKPLMKMSPLT